MREVYGKQVYDSLAEIADPAHTAVIVVDMQNDLVSPGGFVDAQGHTLDGNRSIIPALDRLLDGARQAGVPVVYIQYVMERSYASLSPAWIYHSTRGRLGPGGRRVNLEGCREGTWGVEIIPELAPQPDDFVVQKHRLSGFSRTRLDQVLRANGIQSVVVTGTATGGCVQDTAVDASTHFDYYTVIARDCVAQNDPPGHELALAFLERRFDLADSDELLALWARKEQPAAAGAGG